jgi:hypothetical protein
MNPARMIARINPRNIPGQPSSNPITPPRFTSPKPKASVSFKASRLNFLDIRRNRKPEKYKTSISKKPVAPPANVRENPCNAVPIRTPINKPNRLVRCRIKRHSRSITVIIVKYANKMIPAQYPRSGGGLFHSQRLERRRNSSTAHTLQCRVLPQLSQRLGHRI